MIQIIDIWEEMSPLTGASDGYVRTLTRYRLYFYLNYLNRHTEKTVCLFCFLIFFLLITFQYLKKSISGQGYYYAPGKGHEKYASSIKTHGLPPYFSMQALPDKQYLQIKGTSAIWLPICMVCFLQGHSLMTELELHH